MATADREKLAGLLAAIESQDEAVRALLETVARGERLQLAALPASPISRMLPGCRRRRSRKAATSGS